jgi:hypothetical protein
MFGRIEYGWDLVTAVIKIFFRYPKLFIPWFITLLFYGVIIFSTFYLLVHFYNYSLIIILLTIILISFLIVFSGSILINLIKQIEAKENLSLTKAFILTLKSGLKIAFFSIFFMIIQIFLTIIDFIVEFILLKLKKIPLIGNILWFIVYSIYNLFSWLLQKGIRMVLLFILTATIYENLGSIKGVKKGYNVFKTHSSIFIERFFVSAVVEFLLFLPATIALIFLIIALSQGVILPIWIWMLIFTYVIIIWSFNLYFEQIIVSELYLWHLRWEEETKKMKEETKLPVYPLLRDIEKPSLLKEIPEYHYY